ncbi:hypothetical protein [Frankia tisae]|uniref:hypothetical protein n=1 Tax=Frankia tisae TaxID=2950104 RepID=UPI0021C11FB8|nr:hypothetical protein [Frankia tisae]
MAVGRRRRSAGTLAGMLAMTPAEPATVTRADVDPPTPRPHEALVKVAACSGWW